MELYSPGVVKYTNGGTVYIYSVEKKGLYLWMEKLCLLD